MGKIEFLQPEFIALSNPYRHLVKKMLFRRKTPRLSLEFVCFRPERQIRLRHIKRVTTNGHWLHCSSGPAGAAGAWATPPHPPGPQNRSRDYWPEEAAESLRRAVGTAGPFQGLRADREQRTPPSTPPGPQYLPRNYGPDRSAGWLCRSAPRQADDTTTRASGSGPKRQFDAREFWAKLLHADRPTG